MRFIEVAHQLGITAQELRREVAQINFGIKPTDRDVPDGLAMGIIRVLTPKYKKEIAAARKRDAEEAARLEKERGPLPVAPVVGSEEREEEEEEGNEDREETEEEEQKRKEREEEEARRQRIESYKQQQSSGGARRPAGSSPAPFGARPSRPGDRPARPGDRPQMGGRGAQAQPSRAGGAAAAKAVVMRKIELDPEAVKRAKAKMDEGKHEVEERIKEAKTRAMKRLHTEGYTEEELANMTEEQRLALVTEEMVAKELDDEMFKTNQKRKVIKVIKANQEQIKQKEGVVELPAAVTVKEFAEKAGVPVVKVIGILVKSGIPATINQVIDYETCAIVASDLGVEVKRESAVASEEELLEQDLKKLVHEDDSSLLQDRPPVVVVMGHVDHGKTSILDYFRKTNVVSGESGGITQHIGAYSVEMNGKQITFLDTPGHEAFTAMRARGAKVTDVAILVVAADEGFKPQTIEAMNHAKEAGVPIIVAANKIDKPGANLEMIKAQLSEHDLLPEDWGGKTPVVPCSAKQGEGMEQLLETVLLVAEMEELKANPDRLAVGTVIESHLDSSMGPVATILVNTGTLKIGAPFVIGGIFGKVKTLTDASGKRLRTVGPSGAAQIAGLESVPQAGDILQMMPSEREAKELTEKVAELLAEKRGAGLGVGEIMSRLTSGKMEFLKVVLKADTQGSIEAIKASVAKIKNEDLGIKIIHTAAGTISESDVMMAAASQGIVIGFHVTCPAQVRKLAEREGVEIRLYKIIYELLDDLKKILTGMLKPEEVEVELGELLVKQIFYTKKKSMIVGCSLHKGVAEKGAKVRVTRNGEQVGIETIDTLRHYEKEVDRLEATTDCGLQLVGNTEVKEGDVLMAYKIEQRMKTLD